MALNPEYLYDTSDVLWYGTETYYDAMSALQQISGKSWDSLEATLNARYGAADYWAAVEALKEQGVTIAKNPNGYRCFAYTDKVTMTVPTGPMYSIDSNNTATSIVKASPSYDLTIDDVPTSPTYNKVKINPMGNLLTPQHGFYGWKFFAGECLQALNAVSMGITLGKSFDKLLYSVNPDFWDSVGMSSLNPDTWASITNGDDSFAATLFNMVLGIDPNTGKAQQFIDENAAAYLAYYMKTKGVFNESATHIDINTEDVPPDFNITVINPSPNIIEPAFIGRYGYSFQQETEYTLHYLEFTNNTSPVYTFAYSTGQPNNINSRIEWVCFSENSFTATSHGMNSPATTIGTRNSEPLKVYNGKTCHIYRTSTYNTNFKANDGILPGTVIDISGSDGLSSIVLPATTDNLNSYAWTLLYASDIYESGGIEGITNQPNANLPDTSTWNDIPSTLQSLQTQYPDMWANAVPNTIVQPDGSTQTITYVPVAMPSTMGQWDPQPISSTTTQTQPQVQPMPEPTTENNTLLKTVLQLLTSPEPNPQTETETQTQTKTDVPNGVVVGDGASPVPMIPSGSASALWSVYHPTQGQINSFGAWLWTDNVIQQFIQLLNNPMEGIITLHKVFAMPVDSGSGTIVVGRLDSEVPSATVNQQYVYVDCGSVDVNEYFGNVFDYPPFTTISLYLPFIGFVPLNPDDIMRSTVQITYGVDIFTGACLAIVNVTRDGNNVGMYQYSGVASVEYPLTGAQHSGLISGLLGVAGGVAGVALASTGAGIAAGAGSIAGGLANFNKSNPARSGGFSGNAGAMGVKVPYLIFERPITKYAETFPSLMGYPTNYSVRLGDCSGHVVVSDVHVHGINGTDNELEQIETLLKSGVIV